MKFLTDYDAFLFLKERGWTETNGLLYSPTNKYKEWTKDEFTAVSFLITEYDYAWGGKKC